MNRLLCFGGVAVASGLSFMTGNIYGRIQENKLIGYELANLQENYLEINGVRVKPTSIEYVSPVRQYMVAGDICFYTYRYYGLDKVDKNLQKILDSEN